MPLAQMILSLKLVLSEILAEIFVDVCTGCPKNVDLFKNVDVFLIFRECQ